jgi:hypothetical protein
MAIFNSYVKLPEGSESSKAEVNPPELARSYDGDAMELCPDLDLHKPAIDLRGRQEPVLS